MVDLGTRVRPSLVSSLTFVSGRVVGRKRARGLHYIVSFPPGAGANSLHGLTVADSLKVYVVER